MVDYKIIVEQEHQTVMAHYDVEAKPAEGYQSEKQLESLSLSIYQLGFNSRLCSAEKGESAIRS